LISKKIIGQLAALLLVSGAASAALPPVVDGNSPVTQPPAPASNASMIGMYNRLEQLQREVREMRGLLEEQTYLIESLKKRQRDLYLDTDRRIVELESGKEKPTGAIINTVAGASAVDGKEDTPAITPTPAPTTKKDDKLAYSKALSGLKPGNYQQSITEFSDFVVSFPDSIYLPNALYWLGEASYVTRDFKRAADEFTKVISQFPSHAKAKDAMLKLGFIQYENKQWKESRETLEKLVSSYPGTTAATLAQKRLDLLKQKNK
jgi:tol-pal system protein YbgF